MGLIKAEKAPPAAVPFSMRDIEDQARAILLRAQQQADQILAAAQREAELLRDRAHLEGFESGRTEGLAAGLRQGEVAGRDAALAEHRARLTDLTNALSTAAADFDSARRKLDADALGEVIRLSVAIAERVTKRHGSLDASVLTENMTAAMKMVVSASDVRIAINPEQRATLDDLLPKLKLSWPKLEHLQIVEDVSIAPGGCRIFTNGGVIDADLDQQLNRIASELFPAPTPTSEARA